MILNDVFERFIEESPVSVMARAVLENALAAETVHALFQDMTERLYTRQLLFSDVVGLMGLDVCKVRPSINAAYKKHAETLGVTRKAVDNKINGLESPVGATLVHHTAAAVAPVFEAMGGRRETWLPGYRVKIFDPESMLVLDAISCEDGHAQG